jgi:cytochrome c peroxidase
MQIPPFPNKKIVVITFIFAVTIMSSLFIQSCKKTESLPLLSDDEILNKFLNLPVTAFNYNVTLPLHFTTNTGGALPTSIAGLDNTPPNNLSTNEGALLGRVLFYDKNLSKNGTISCGSCHLQAKGFSDSKTLSKGFLDGNTRRHSMTLINSRFYRRGRFFWDERAATLEDQVLMPFQDAVEMGMTLNEVVNFKSFGSIYSNHSKL